MRCDIIGDFKIYHILALNKHEAVPLTKMQLKYTKLKVYLFK